MDPEDFIQQEIANKRNYATDGVPGEASYDRDFSESVVKKIADHNFKK